jgi:tetratricopeptide (TPR) repeat protein
MASPADTLDVARQRHRAGDPAGAAHLYRQVLRDDPANAEVLALLGLACYQQGDVVAAEGWYRQALALQPEEPDLHFYRGLCLQGLGRGDKAAGHFREAVRLRPDFAEAWNNLGNVLFLVARAAEAVPCYEQAVRHRPGWAEACMNLGSALREDDRVEEGLAWYRQAVRLRPVYPKAHNNLGVALLELGQVAKAEAHFREALRQQPDSAQVLWNLASYGLYRDTDPGPDRLRARLADPRLAPMDACQLHFTLAYRLEHAGAHDEAFHHFREGNRRRRDMLRQAGTAFDPAAHSRLIDRLAEVFSLDCFERVRGRGLDTDVPVFVVGMPRSGTSLVEQVLAQHPEAAGAGELRDIPRLADVLPALLGGGEYPECVRRLDRETARSKAEAYLDRLRRLGGGARRVTDKLPENFLHLGLIATLFPGARVVHCRRDPLDVCVSCYCRFFQGMNFSWDLGDLGRYYREYERLMAHWRAVLPLPLLDVTYEDLVADPEGQGRRLLAFCGLGWHERCLRFYESPRAVRTPSKLQVRQPVYRSAVGRWQRYAAHLGPLREALGLPAG